MGYGSQTRGVLEIIPFTTVGMGLVTRKIAVVAALFYVLGFAMGKWSRYDEPLGSSGASDKCPETETSSSIEKASSTTAMETSAKTRGMTQEKESSGKPAGSRMPADSPIEKSVWDLNPMEHTAHVNFANGCTTDAFNPFSNYVRNVWDGVKDRQATFPELPFFTTWPHYMEAYHNHMHRFRSTDPNNKVVFMEVGVQYGGKIPLLRDYFGPGFTYIGVDINEKTKIFGENADWIHIEIGDSSDREFLRSLKKKYPHIDIFLDDGGHKMHQQMVTIEEMLPHVQPEGVFLCEDLSTSWSPSFGGVINGTVDNKDFRDKTMMGYIHKTIDWLNVNWISGGLMRATPPEDDSLYPPLWKIIHTQVKHIHLYDQMVVYEKGVPMVPRFTNSVGTWVFEPKLPGQVNGQVNWDLVLKKIQKFSGSPWEW